jgi:hypothetical protein
MVSFKLIHRFSLVSQLYQGYLEGFIIHKLGVDGMPALLCEQILGISISRFQVLDMSKAGKKQPT